MAADHGHPQPPEAAQPPFGARNRLTGSPGRIVARHPDGQHTANKRPALTLRLFATATAQSSSSRPSQPAQRSGVADALIEACAQRLSRSPRTARQVSTAVCPSLDADKLVRYEQSPSPV